MKQVAPQKLLELLSNSLSYSQVPETHLKIYGCPMSKWVAVPWIQHTASGHYSHQWSSFTIFSPSGEQPEQCILSHKLWQPTAGCIAIFHKYCCYKKGGIMTNWTSLGYITPKYHNACIWGTDKNVIRFMARQTERILYTDHRPCGGMHNLFITSYTIVML